MEIIKVVPRGYCKGVTRAISIAKETAQKYPNKSIYVLGMLVHNRYVMQALEALNIHAVDDPHKTRLQLLDELPKDCIVIFTAHGIAPQVIEKAKQMGLICIDASCPDVVKTQQLVYEKLNEGYDVFYIGKRFHPEAEAVLSLSSHVHLITSKEDIDTMIDVTNVFVTNQTTMSIFDTQALFNYIKQKYPNAVLCEEICNATRIRQEAVANLKNQAIDVLYVVGDKHSNNSNRLAQIAQENKIANVYLIDDVNDIEEAQFAKAKRIGITSGASTPTYLTSQVIHYLESYEQNKQKPRIEIEKIL